MTPQDLGVCPYTIDRPVMWHRWERLTFLHWRFEPADVQRLVPDGLEAETAHGAAGGGLGLQLLRDERAHLRPRPGRPVRHLVLLPRRVPPGRGPHRASHALPAALLLVVDAAQRARPPDRVPVRAPLARPPPGHLPGPDRHRRADRTHRGHRAR